jgi:cbb3-type cytochrome oxidase subunit 3
MDDDRGSGSTQHSVVYYYYHSGWCSDGAASDCDEANAYFFAMFVLSIALLCLLSYCYWPKESRQQAVERDEDQKVTLFVVRPC